MLVKYRMRRSDGPLRPMPEGGCITGGDDTHVDVEVPEGVEVPAILERVKKKAKRSDPALTSGPPDDG